MTNPAIAHLTLTELATAYAAAEVAQVKRSVAAALDAHPLRGTDPSVWEYMQELMRIAFLRGVAAGRDDTMVDMNTRYTMRPRSLPPID